jgi:hypothetical protein
MAKPPGTTPADASSAVPAGGGPARRRRTSHGFRWFVRWLVGVPVVLGLVVLLVIRSPVVGSVAAGRIGALTGCTVEGLGVGGAAIDLDGNLILDHFALRAPGVPGDAGEFLKVQHAVVDLDWSGVLLGKVRARTITLTRPVFTLSQSMADGSVNVAAIKSAASPSGPAALPDVNVVDAEVVLGEHDAAGAVRVLKEMELAGSFMAQAGKPQVYGVRLSERGRAAEKSLVLDGSVDLGSGAMGLKLYNVALDAWGPEAVPTEYRALWRRLNVQGALPTITLAYDARFGLRTEIAVENVSMNVPVEAPDDGRGGDPETGAPPAAAGGDLGLQGVTGTVTFSNQGLSADLRGRVAGQEGRSHVVFNTRGADLNAALTCEIVALDLKLTKEAQFLPYMPGRAREYLRVFSGPTAVVRVARLVVSRDEPVGGEAAPIRVSGGRLRFENGSAAFQRFPYPFHAMTGELEFDDQKVEIKRIEGLGPTGARLTATGIVTPLTDDAMIDVHVHAEGVPTDEHLLAAMPRDRREVFETVFSRPEYDRLVAVGLLRDPVEGRGDGDAPRFALGGTANVDVHVHSPRGKDAPWFTTVDVAFPSCGVLVDVFPVPVLATDVALHITDDDAKLTSGTFRPLSGGTIDLSALVKFREGERKVVKPDVRVEARGVPVDRYVVAALPGSVREPPAGDAPAPPAGELTAAEVLRRLHVTGSLDATAAITEAAARADGQPPSPSVDYRVRVDLRNVHAAPAVGEGPAAFSVENLSGSVLVRPEELRVDGLTATLVRNPLPGDAGAGSGPWPAAGLELSLRRGLEHGPGALRGVLAADLRVSDLSLTEPIERLVGVFAPRAAERMSKLRAEREPTGVVQATVAVTQAPGEGGRTDATVRLGPGSAVEVGAMGGRVGADWPEGSAAVSLSTEGPTRVSLDGVTAGLWMNGRACGVVRAGGAFTLDAERGSIAPPADLRATLDGWRFDSPLIPPLLERFTEASVAEKYRGLAPAGALDAAVQLSTEGAPAGRARLSMSMAPRALAFTYGGERVDLKRVEGRVTLEALTGPGPAAVSGRLERLTAHAERWTAFADGAWGVPPSDGAPGAPVRGVTLDLDLGLEAQEIDAPLRAVLPGGAGRALRALEARFEGPVALTDAHVRTLVGAGAGADAAAPGTAPSPDAGTVFNGRVRFENAALGVGVPIDRCTGALTIHVDDRPAPVVPGGPATSFVVGVNADTLRIAGVTARGARCTVTTTERDGEVVVPDLAAEAHGGRVSGRISARSAPAPGGPPAADGAAAAPMRYDAEVVLAGVRLAPVLSDLAAQGVTDPGPVGPPDPNTEPDPSRGVVDARLKVEGVSGDAQSRSGDGAIRVVGGDVLRLPLMLPLLQVSNFQAPGRDRLSYLQSDFRIRGDKAVFDHVTLLSRSVAIVGSGTLSLGDYRVDMRFNSKAISRLPVLSDLLEMVRDEIVTTRVTGRLADPSVRAEPFMGTRRMIDAVLNPGTQAAVGSLLEASRAAQAERDRLESAAGAAVMPSEGR